MATRHPILTEISGAQLPIRKIDGVSLLPLIEGRKDANPRESFVYYYNKNDPGERYDVISQYPEEAAKLMKIADRKRDELGDNLMRMKGTERREPGYLTK